MKKKNSKEKKAGDKKSSAKKAGGRASNGKNRSGGKAGNGKKKSKKKKSIDLSKVVARLWREEDIPELVEVHAAVYSDFPPHRLDDQRLYEMQFAAFPEGQYLLEYRGKIVGYATSLIVCVDDSAHPYKLQEITGASTFSTHDYGGDILYGADIGVHPDYRGHGLSRLLYEKRKALMINYNLRQMVAYGRLPGYPDHAGKMDAKQYVQRVVDGEFRDPALSAHLKAGYRVRRVLLDFMSDEASLNYATLLEMDNPDFDKDRHRISASLLEVPARTVRVGAGQYFFRPISTWEEFEDTVRFYVDTADNYHCHFLLLPEYFTAQLFSLMPREWEERKTVEKLADMAEQIVEMLQAMAQEYHIYIIGGSTPMWRDGKLYNVAPFVTPSGKVYYQDKLHITPAERNDWGIHPGEGVKVFQTPLGTIAISICYDIEFPELARMLTLRGAEVFFVPYSTDEKNGYYRVRYTSQARAVENYVYVVTAGNVGNLPRTNYLLNYGQSAVYTPSDFSFPPEAVKASADANTETVVITDLDLNTLNIAREIGNVRPLFDRRPDIYSLRARVPVELIRTE